MTEQIIGKVSGNACGRLVTLVIFALILSICKDACSLENNETGSFQFGSIKSLEEMQSFVKSKMQIGARRSDVENIFIAEGRATKFTHPTQVGIAKYIYDVNLCGYYVWRWNISADYDENDSLLQIYINGEPVFSNGKQKKNSKLIATSGKAAIFKMSRHRTAAYKVSNELVYTVLDADGNLNTIDDQVLVGGGPSKVDPVDGGTVHMYIDVEPWRSIFDSDRAANSSNFPGQCETPLEKTGR